MSLRLSVLFDGKNSKLKASAKEANKTLDGVKSTAIGVAKSIGAAYASYISIGQIVDVTKRYQKLQAQLRTATGSIRNQNAAFAALQQYARDTGQNLDSLIQGFNKLVNLGLDPSKEALHAYGNVAAATGKTTMDFIEAVADASVAEFERLKEFGIKAKNEGDTITFRFRGVSTTVKNTSEDIQNYLKALGQNEFGDALANQATTLEATINRLGLSWDQFVFQISEAGAGQAMSSAIGLATSALDELNSMLASGELQGYVAAWSGQFTGVMNDIRAGLDALYIDLQGSSLIFQAFGEEFTTFITGAIKEFPTNVRTMIKILTVELASLVDIGRAYGRAFAEVIGIQLAKMVRKAGIYGQEIADALSFWDGDTFDPTEALAIADQVARDMTYKAFEVADAKVNASREARLATITEAIKERDEQLQILDEGLQAAKLLREQYEQGKAANDSFDLGQFNTGGGGEAENDAIVDDGTYEKLQAKYATEEEALLLHYEREKAIIENALAQRKITEDQYLQLMTAAHQQHLTDAQRLSNQKANMMLTSSQQIFNGLAGIVKSFGGEQTTAYKALFAISKGFAVAQGILNLSTAISNASALPFPTNIPAMAQAAATGAQLVSTLKGAQYQGQAHDGLSRVPAANEGTFLLRRDEMVLNPRQRENFDAMAEDYKENGGGKGGGTVVNITNNISVDAQGASEGTELQIQGYVEQAIERNNEQLREDFSSNGPLAQAFRGAA